MTRDPLERLFDESQDVELDALLALLGRETEAMKQALPEALARQWEASPVPKPREDTSQRASGDRPNPTEAIVLDARRLALRTTIEEVRQAVRHGVVRVRAGRLALDHAVKRYDGAEG